MGTSINDNLSGGHSAKERIRPGNSGRPSTLPKHWTSGLNFHPFAKVKNDKYLVRKGHTITEHRALKSVIEALSYAQSSQVNLTEIPKVQTDCQALYYYLEKAEGLANSLDAEFLLVRHKHGQIETINKFDVDGFKKHGIVPIKPIWDIKPTNPVLFKVLASIVHYLIKVNYVPVFQRDLLGYVHPEMINSEDGFDKENYYARKTEYQYYKKDTPSISLKFIKKMKPLSLKSILEYPAEVKLKRWINQVVKVIDSKVKFRFDELDSYSESEEGLNPANVCYITWDCDSVTEQEYGQFLDCHANELGVKVASKFLRPRQTGWNKSGSIKHLKNLSRIMCAGYVVISESRLKHQPKKYAK